MLNFVYNFYFSLRRRKYNTQFLRKINSFLCIFLRRFTNIYVKVLYTLPIKKNKLGINTSDTRKRKVIVSLTTFPGRINTVWIAIESLLNQSFKPDEIILWLAKDQFNGYKSLPNKLLEQQKRGLSIRFCDDLRSHKKYYYAFKENPNDIIITVDDDIIYPKCTIEVLINLNKKFPKSICCNRAHLITKTRDDKISPYNDWIHDPLDFNEPSKLLCPTGVSGVLYPPNSVNEEIFNKHSIKNLCFYADDLWLKIMSLKNNTQVVKSSNFSGVLFTIDSSQKESLAQINVDKNKNDEQLNAILNKYKVDFD